MSDSLPPPRRKPAPAKASKFEMRPNTGSLWFEETKQSDRHPDCKGRIRLGDRVFTLAGWMHTSPATGREYLSLQVDKELL